VVIDNAAGDSCGNLRLTPGKQANDLTTTKRQPLQWRLDVTALFQDIGIDGLVKEFQESCTMAHAPD
jgi:hypothetical protein